MKTEMINIAAQTNTDLPDILALHRLVFGQPAEAELVEALCQLPDFNSVAAHFGYAGVVVLGDNGYYERFGFAHSLVAHIECEYQCEHYMGHTLGGDAFSPIKALHYPEPFAVLDKKTAA